MTIEMMLHDRRGLLPRSSSAVAVLAAAATLAVADEPCEPYWDNAFGQPGMNSSVNSLAVFDDGSGPALYAGGQFNMAGGVSANRIAKWDGQSWSALGSGVDGVSYPWVLAMAVFDDGSGPALYAGGGFTTAGDVEVNYIAKWDGQSWSALGSGMNNRVNALAVFDDGSGPALYAAGWFWEAGGVSALGIAKWDGQSWSALGGGMGGHPVYALTAIDDGCGSGPALYAGGGFPSADGVSVNGVARWDGQAWSALGSGVSGSPYGSSVSAMTPFDDGSGSGPALYVGGEFPLAGEVSANNIARWDGDAWSALGSGVGGVVHALTVFDDGSGPALFAGGSFFTAGGVGANRIAKWDGQSWSPLGSGMGGGEVLVFTVFDDGFDPRGSGGAEGAGGSGPALYAGGWFTTAGGATANRIAKWQGCPSEPECSLADLNCDSVVDVSDLLILFANWGSCPWRDSGNCPADINGDGTVDVSDLLILLANWG